MALSLHTIKPSNGASRAKKRIGRGNASGHGTYSTRGLKGQRSRTGGRNKLKRLGLKMILSKLPKNRGFKSALPKNQVINVNDLNGYFPDGGKISPAGLLKAGLIGKINLPVKLLGDGQLKLKNLLVEDILVSQSAREQIEKMGGKIGSKK